MTPEPYPETIPPQWLQDQIRHIISQQVRFGRTIDDAVMTAFEAVEHGH